MNIYQKNILRKLGGYAVQPYTAMYTLLDNLAVQNTMTLEDILNLGSEKTRLRKDPKASALKTAIMTALQNGFITQEGLNFSITDAGLEAIQQPKSKKTNLVETVKKGKRLLRQFLQQVNSASSIEDIINQVGGTLDWIAYNQGTQGTIQLNVFSANKNAFILSCQYSFLKSQKELYEKWVFETFNSTSFLHSVISEYPYPFPSNYWDLQKTLESLEDEIDIALQNLVAKESSQAYLSELLNEEYDIVEDTIEVEKEDGWYLDKDTQQYYDKKDLKFID